jgi:hypothetical protein
VDDLGQAYLIGDTGSAAYFHAVNALFPTLPDSSTLETHHVFLTKLSPTGHIEFNTLLGGNGEDFAGGVAVGSNGGIYVSGTTNSADIPVTAGLEASPGPGYTHGFALKLANDGSQVLWGTYLGGSRYDQVYSIAVDANGAAYVAGTTQSADLPTVHARQAAYRGNSDGFVAAIAPDGQSFNYFTYLGGSGDDQANAIAVDAAGNASIVGSTTSANFPTQNAFQSKLGSGDAFVTRLGAGDASTKASTIVLSGVNIKDVEGNAFNGQVASFTSNGTETADQFSAMIDWGDGSSSAGTIGGNFESGFQVLGRHVYTKVGEYDTRVTLRDSLGRPVTVQSTAPGFDAGHALYHVVIDTSSLAGTSGQLAFQFNPGAPGGPDVEARISGLTLTGGTVGAAPSTMDGGASIDQSGNIVLGPRAVLNRLIDQVTLGTKIELDLDLSGPGMTKPGGGSIGDVFAVQLLSQDGKTTLLVADRTDSILRVAVGSDGSTRLRSADPSVTAGVTADARGHATVSDAPLQLKVLPFTAQEGLAYDGTVATFTSANPLATSGDFTATINWADGSSATAGVVAFDGTHFTVSGTHAYLRAGEYLFSVSITDPDGVTTTKASSVTQGGSVKASFGPNLGMAASHVLLSADFNNDGKPDLVAAPVGQFGVSVLLGNGDFTFGAPIPIPTPDFFTAVTAVAADFNGDGKLDLAISDGGQLEILLGNGDGSFTPGPAAKPYGGPVMAAGDFYGDGKTDLASEDGYSHQIAILRGNGDGSFQDRVFLNNGVPFAYPVSMAVADLDNDHRSDIVVADGTNFLKIFQAGADGVFGSAQQVDIGPPSPASSVEPVAVGDVTGDGIPDIVVGASDLVVLAGDRSGGFTVNHYATPVAPQLLAIGDLNNDCRADVVVGDTVARPVAGSGPPNDGRIEVLRSLPGGGFAAGEPIVGPVSNGPLSIADWNGDGNIDVADLNAVLADSFLHPGPLFYPGRGDGTLQAARTELVADQYTTALLTTDVNGDGSPDLVTSSNSGLIVSLGNGTGHYDQPTSVRGISGVTWGSFNYPSDGATELTVATADLNGDGRLDLVSGSSVWLQMPDGQFAAPRTYGGPARESVIGDLNGE